jgi:hypothetical protein
MMNVLRKLAKVGGWTVIVLAVFGAAYLLLIRPWHRTWGASSTETGRPMPGDATVSEPDSITTRAVTVDAPPEQVWPWLAQLGYRRGGRYSYDWIDRAMKILDGPSAVTIRPEFQDLKAGSVISMGNGPSWSVIICEPPSTLAFEIRRPGVHATWSWLLSPVEGGKTRLVLRIRGRLERPSSALPLRLLLDPGEFIMVHRMLGGIKARAEGRAQTPAGELFELSLWAAAALIGLIALAAAFLRKSWKRPFIVAGLAAAVVLNLSLRQPSPIAGALFDAGLAALLILSLSPRRRPKLFGNSPANRV